MSNLSSQYRENGQLEECIDMCRQGMEFCFQCGKGMRLGKFLANKAEGINVKENKSTQISEKLLKQAYYMSDLFSVRKVMNYIDNYYCLHYLEDVVWN